MHLKREERCPIKSKSHLQNFFCICPSLSGMQTRHIFAFCFRFSSLCVTRLWPCELWHLAFSKIIFRKMPFFSCFWQKINAFMPWAVLSVQKKAAALIWPLHEWQGFLRRHFCHRSLNLKQEKWFFMKRTMSEKIM